MQDIGGFGHLDHERRLAGGEVVACAHAREDAVQDPDAREPSGDEAAHLGHEADKRNLPQVGALTCHVGAGHNEHLAVLAIEMGVVGHEGFGQLGALDHRVAAVSDLDGV